MHKFKAILCHKVTTSPQSTCLIFVTLPSANSEALSCNMRCTISKAILYTDCTRSARSSTGERALLAVRLVLRARSVRPAEKCWSPMCCDFKAHSSAFRLQKNTNISSTINLQKHCSKHPCACAHTREHAEFVMAEALPGVLPGKRSQHKDARLRTLAVYKQQLVMHFVCSLVQKNNPWLCLQSCCRWQCTHPRKKKGMPLACLQFKWLRTLQIKRTSNFLRYLPIGSAAMSAEPLTNYSVAPRIAEKFAMCSYRLHNNAKDVFAANQWPA
jgi:hypothetical protein